MKVFSLRSFPLYSTSLENSVENHHALTIAGLSQMQLLQQRLGQHLLVYIHWNWYVNYPIFACVVFLQALFETGNYRMAGNFGKVFNLAIWRIW